mmetsp:Transcript_70732/g.153604  ORF Transcript_70732/g.153604 Transcript_70732/m.153604 type:complete len:496 (-) Transcript_70732:82-1569(-)|eukprot:CAMPEP_0170601956 /NCGR_PEP_ID=MMETSP0224-20130122/18136_1 /TAXON_ID=285029 /ORGANISM="Togula jolla, Strain CCCM 725" /LENGTH=495 /DNA_ID=CAMNT_0010926767 /DNA_START=70 /DNA_END=1557 /DNA_ORIENTATION=-
MASSKATAQGVVGAAAAAILISRIRDARHVPRLFLDKGEKTPVESAKILVTALAIFAYERSVAALLRRLGLVRMPSTLAAMLSLFAALRTVQKIKDRETAERLAALLKPGVDFLGKWMGLFLAPPLVSLDASIAALPRYSQGVWANLAALLGLGWTTTHCVAAAVATRLAPERSKSNPALQGANAAKGAGSSRTRTASKPKTILKTEEVSQEEAVRRAWVFIGSLSYLATALLPGLPVGLHRPIGMMCELSTTVGSLALAKLLPEALQRVLHPLVICAVSSNLATRFVGPSAPYFDGGAGVGDRLFQWLPAAVTGLGVRMFNTTGLWLDDAGDFRCVLGTCGVSGCVSLGVSALAAVAVQSPLSIPAPLSLPLLHRSVMSALGIEGSKAVGPECDPKLAVASILITGCIGASLGKALLESFPAIFNASSPLVRGLAMGCSAHSIGTAGLISYGDTEAAAISGAAMCLAGTAHTAVLSIPGVVPAIRRLAALPPLA